MPCLLLAAALLNVLYMQTNAAALSDVPLGATISLAYTIQKDNLKILLFGYPWILNVNPEKGFFHFPISVIPEYSPLRLECPPGWTFLGDNNT